MTSPPPLIPIHGYNHIHHVVVNPFMSNRQSESQAGTSYDRQPYNVQEITIIGVRNQQYDKHSFAQNADFAKQLEPEFNPLQRSTQGDAEFSPTLLCHHFHLPQDNGYQEKRGLKVPKIVADVDSYWYRRNLNNVATIGCLNKEIQRLQMKLKSVEDIRDVQVAATQSNAVEWKKQKENPRQFFQCKTCVKKYTTKKGLQPDATSDGTSLRHSFSKTKASKKELVLLRRKLKQSKKRWYKFLHPIHWNNSFAGQMFAL